MMKNFKISIILNFNKLAHLYTRVRQKNLTHLKHKKSHQN